MGGRRGDGARRVRPIDLPQFAYQFTIPGVFVQDDVELTRWLSLSASGRLDYHSEYGTFLSPRVAALFALRSLEQPRVDRHRVLRAERADGGNRGRRIVTADDSATTTSGGRAGVVPSISLERTDPCPIR